MKKISIFFLGIIVLVLSSCMYQVGNPSEPNNPNNPDNPGISTDYGKLYSGAFNSMGTVISFQMYAKSQNEANNIFNGLKEIYKTYDEISDDGFDVWFGQDNSSELAQLNLKRELEVSSELKELLEFAILMQGETNGYFNPFMGTLNHEWKEYLEKGSMGAALKPSEHEVAFFLNEANNTSLEIDGNVVKIVGDGNIDLGGVAKGYATNKAYEYLESMGVRYYLLNAGNSNILLGEKPEVINYNVGVSYIYGYPNPNTNLSVKDGVIYIDEINTNIKANSNARLLVGVEEAYNISYSDCDYYFNTNDSTLYQITKDSFKAIYQAVLTTISGANTGVCTSSPSEQHYFDGEMMVHHLVNPKTGYPADIRDSVTILGLDSGRLDAYSTAIFSMSDEEAKAFMAEQEIKGLFSKNGKITYQSEGIL